MNKITIQNVTYEVIEIYTNPHLEDNYSHLLTLEKDGKFFASFRYKTGIFATPIIITEYNAKTRKQILLSRDLTEVEEEMRQTELSILAMKASLGENVPYNA